MKTKWKMLTLAALLSAGTTTANAADDGYVGDLGEDAYYADSTDYVNDLYNEDSAAPAAAESAIEEVVEEVVEEAQYYPSELETVSYVGDGGEYAQQNVGSGIPTSLASYGCQTGDCNGGCGPVAAAPVYMPTRRVAKQTSAWLTAEALLWFPQVRSTVPLVSQNTAGALPELDQGATVAFGGQDAFGGDLQAGFRLDGGVMLSEDFGMGGRFWMLGEAEDTYNASGDGTTGSIGIPYFDSDLIANQENALIIAYSDGTGAGDVDFQGQIAVRSTLEMYGAEGYGRLRLLGGKGYRSDFIGGFSHFGIEEGLTLAATTTQTEVGAGQGDVYRFNDDITAENKFYGGQIGFLTTVGRGAWTLSALTKVHLGNMDQTWTSRGSRGRAAFADQAGGIFANNAEQTIEESNFSFAPEANIKLAYKMRPNVSFSVGYSFIMWDDVLMIGDNLNRDINTGYLVLDGAGAVDAAERPQFLGLETDSFFVHGVDLGCVIQF
ncbi:BBP7 family outer membrane beta-barrel protein [Aporhodopirellula aestuarii]|uniref:BBP7 family outer membrane beta-barrel protein n=1 Tax=Aporhodopirellula aestuarii TaxID=2950107 RepID=A0ABT0U4E0_9BACT|nr:BBP7 family outer membrane beta-barrel protein [Aporhodopirellula aestuarii]MCM2371789.1 BBP7 family outer membrane beta-barrel protein [Aporhodopirellula aestuarii]